MAKQNTLVIFNLTRFIENNYIQLKLLTFIMMSELLKNFCILAKNNSKKRYRISKIKQYVIKFVLTKI